MSHQEKETYKHYYAKMVAADWFRSIKGFKVYINLPFYKDQPKNNYFELLESGKAEFDKYGEILFVPDISIVSSLEDSDVIILYIVEIVHSSQVSGYKISTIEDFFRFGKISLSGIYELSADWILSQIKQPKEIEGTWVRTERIVRRSIEDIKIYEINKKREPLFNPEKDTKEFPI